MKKKRNDNVVISLIYTVIQSRIPGEWNANYG